MKSLATFNRAKALSLVLLSSFFLASCDSVTGVKGTISDRNGAPLEAVQVTLESGSRVPDKFTTDKTGAYEVGIVGADPRDARVTFKKDGYRVFEKRLETSGRVKLDVTLEAEAR